MKREIIRVEPFDTNFDASDFLWITRGIAVWGRDAAMKRFAALYQGTWRLAPDLSGLKVVIIGEGVAQLYVPITFTIGASGGSSAGSTQVGP